MGHAVRLVVSLWPTVVSLTGVCFIFPSHRGMSHIEMVLAFVGAAFTLPGPQHPVWGLVMIVLERVDLLTQSTGRPEASKL